LALSLTRGLVYILQLLVGLASEAILESGSRKNRVHILLSQKLKEREREKEREGWGVVVRDTTIEAQILVI
jgi:hypothetical protein